MAAVLGLFGGGGGGVGGLGVVSVVDGPAVGVRVAALWHLLPTGLTGDLGMWVCYVVVTACIATIVYHALRRGTNSWGASWRRGASVGSQLLSDLEALRLWRAQCPELRALWDESEAVTAEAFTRPLFSIT
jgi:hypothetical protein